MLATAVRRSGEKLVVFVRGISFKASLPDLKSVRESWEPRLRKKLK